MRRDQNDHAKTNNQTPEPEGSGRKHCETELPMRLLGTVNLKKAPQNRDNFFFFITLINN
jgi:hypothetical protein